MTMTETDPYTVAARLCDDRGMVSREPIEGDGNTLDASYLERHNRLRNQDRDVMAGARPVTEEPFLCTGSAHMAGNHIRCTSPAHTVHLGAAGMVGDYLPLRVVINGVTYVQEDPPGGLGSSF